MTIVEGRQDTSSREVATVFKVVDEALVGVLHGSDNCGSVGVLFLVGGRQYRTGAQRQFVRLGRCLAAAGYPAFRFDVRGMGDSAAEPMFFLDTAEDISAAITEFKKLVPQLKQILLWGLCDGASAAIVYASIHPGVDGVMMVNPWITTKSGAAGATLKHYYQKRLVSAGFWRQVLNGNVNLADSLRSLAALVRQRFGATENVAKHEVDLPAMVFDAMEKYYGRVNVIISEYDLTAKEFKDVYDKRYGGNKRTPPVSHIHEVQADHTFSSLAQHGQLETLTLEWCHMHARRANEKL